MADLSQEDLAKVASDLMATKMYSLAACVMIFYDIVITMEDEVEYIWKAQFTFFTVLWLLNRYLSPLIYIVIIVSFHDPWSKEVCDRYILFPEATKVVTCFVIGVIFICRVYAIYARNKNIAILGSIFLVAEIGVKIWAFTDGEALDLPAGLVGCILVGKSPPRYSFSWIAELLFDSLIFGLTFWRAVWKNRGPTGSARSLLEIMMRDGAIYFGVIFAANATTVIMLLVAPPNIKGFNASFSTLITSLMTSRLILNLRKAGRGPITYESKDRRASRSSQHGVPPLEFRSYPRGQTRPDYGQEAIRLEIRTQVSRGSDGGDWHAV